MSKITLAAEVRTDSGKGASRRLRHTDQIPAIIYGAEKTPVQITLAGNIIRKASEQDDFYARPITLELNGASEDVIVKDLQRNPVNESVTHLDFLRLDANAPLTINVPLHFINAEQSAALNAGGALAKFATTVQIRCLPANLPEFLEVDLSALEIGGTLALSSITFPEGVESVLLTRGHDQGVAGILATRSSRQGDDEEGEGEAATEAEAEA